MNTDGVQQNIGGSGHQVAGRDIVNKGNGYKPDPNNPKLMDCKCCGRPGLSVNAASCPACEHDYLSERIADEQARREHARVEADRWHSNMLFGLIMLSLCSLFVSKKFEIGILDSFAIAAGLMVAGWAAWTYAWIRIEAWVQRRFC